MKGKDIKACLSEFPIVLKHFQGIYRLEDVSNVHIKNLMFIIVYVSNSVKLELGHWISIFRNEQNHFEIFDTFGALHKDRIIHALPKDIAKAAQINESEFQCRNSKNCGAFTLYAIVARILNLDETFSEFLNHSFTSNCLDNEKRVKRFFFEHGFSEESQRTSATQCDKSST